MANAVTFDVIGRDRGGSRVLEKVGLSAKAAGRELEGMDRKVSGLSGKFGMVSRVGPKSFHAVATGTKAAALGLGALAVAGAVAFKGFLDDARESSKVSRITANVIKQTGGAAKISAKQVGDLATAISNKTGVDDEAIQSGANLLLTFKRVRNEVGRGNDVFNRATKAAADLSAAGFGDLSGASKMLGKALNDPLKGLTALGRAGVTFTKQQQDQIKTLVKAGDVLGAQKIILKEVESQVGGAAAAASTPMDKLRVIVGNLGERLGGYLIPWVDKAATWLGKTLPQALDMAVKFISGTAIPAVKGFAGAFAAGFSGRVPTTGGFFGYVSTLGLRIGELWRWTRDTAVPGIVTAFTDIKAKVEAALPKIDLSGIARSFVEQAKGWGTALINGVKQGLDTGDWSGLGETVGRGLVAAIGAAANLAKNIAGKIGELFGKVDWVGLGITVGKQAIPFVLGLAVGILNVDLFALLKGLAAHWQEAFLAVIALALTPAKIIGPVGRLLARIPLVGKFLETALLWTKGLADGLVRGVGRALAFLGRAFLDGFRTVFPRVGAAFAEWLGLLPIRIGVAALNVRAAAIRMIRSLGQAIADGAAWVVRNIGQLIAQMLRPWVNAARWLINAGRQFVSGLVGGIRSYLSLAASATAQVIRTIVSRFVGAERWLVRAGVQILQGLLQGLLQQWRNVADWLGRVGRGIVARFIGAGRWLFGIGSDIIGGLWAGFRSAMSRVGDVLKTVKDAIVGGLKTLFHIGSPSRVMAELGGHMITGLIKGMLTQSGALAQTVKSIGGTAAGLFGNILGSPGGGLVPNTNPSGVQAMVKGYAQLLYGWQGAQWNALYNLLMGESGFNPNAQNPTSSAYGIFQFLNSTWGSVGARKTSNPNDQTIAGLRYIKQRYGTPANAYGSWLSRSPHWYGSGLSPTVFSRPTLIGVGEGGPETVSVIPHGRGGGGATTPLHVTVNLNGPILGNAREIARQLLPAIEGQLKQRGRDVGRPNRL